MKKQPISHSDFEIGERITLINERLFNYLAAYPYQTPGLFEAAVYSVKSPGHRWRPILLLKIYESLSGVDDSNVVLPVACAVEFVHTASVILDDLPAMDDATLRRGKKPCHLEFGEARAILAAHWLCDVAHHLIHEFQLGNNMPSADPDNLLRLVKNEMMQGQLSDLLQGGLTEDQILKVYRQKSGALYGFTASVPAYLLGLTREAEHLNEFGNLLGIAYQISDDIHDCTDVAEEIGKDVNQDFAKSTIPRVHGVEKAITMRDDYKNRAVAALDLTPAATGPVIDLVEKICF